MDDRVYSPADLLDSIRIAKVSLYRGKPIIGVRQLKVCHVTAPQQLRNPAADKSASAGQKNLVAVVGNDIAVRFIVRQLTLLLQIPPNRS